MADLLGLPFPPQRMQLAALDQRLAVVDQDGSPLPLETRPLFRALREHTDAEGFIYQRRGDETLTIRARAVSFHSPTGEFLGVADYLRVEAPNAEA